MSIGPLSKVNFDLKELADFHSEKLSDFKKGSANYQYHFYRYKQIIGACAHLENAIMSLPSDFTE